MDDFSYSALPVPAQIALVALSLTVGIALEIGVVYVVFFLLTLPMRRNERARLFLDLLELGLKEGRSPEAALVDAAASRDPALGARFYLLGAHLEKGRRLGEALADVPRLLPPQVVAMLRAGERIGDITKVLPASRRLLGDGVSQVRGALNYLLILGFVVTPFSLFIPILLAAKIIPQFKLVFAGMAEGVPLPAFSALVLSGGNVVMGVQIAMLLLIWFLILGYLGGSRFHNWLGRFVPGAPDWIRFHLPWRRKRLQRDFSAVLAVLLDAGVPEGEAVTLAADATANSAFRRRAEEIRAFLNNGVKLPDAIRRVDDTGELHWRLANALHRGRDFLRALSGWHEALDAKAFQLEQTAAQIATTALVLLNGLIIGSIVAAVFLVLIRLVNEVALW